jgi:hypothetical protein
VRIAGQCQERALLLLQIAQECPQVRELAEYLAGQWLLIATIRTDLARIGQTETETRPN